MYVCLYVQMLVSDVCTCVCVCPDVDAWSVSVYAQMLCQIVCVCPEFGVTCLPLLFDTLYIKAGTLT